MPNNLDVSDLPKGVKSVNIKEQKVFDGIPFPLTLSPTDNFKDKDAKFWNDWVKANLKVIESLLLKHGAVLFRGFPFDTPNDFDQYAKAYGYDIFKNAGGLGVRTNVVGNVFIATETPADYRLPFHHEMAHMPDYPHVIFFYCDTPAKEGGNTPIVLSNVIYRKMLEREPELVERLEKEGLRYLKVATDGNNPKVIYGKGWQSTFLTNSKEEAERIAKAAGYDFEWLEDGSMKLLSDILPAIRVDKRTGKKMWFNSILPVYLVSQHSNDQKNFNVYFPNFDTISAEIIESLEQVLDEVKVSFKWQRKDVLMVDNRIVQHSKDKFAAPPRINMVSLFSDHQGPI